MGAANPIRGINGGGLPWQIAAAKGELTSTGKVEVEVRGLVLLDGPPVPVNLQGTNPAAAFRAVVSCLSTVDGAATTVNVATDPFLATTTGDAKIEADIDLPSPCIAPIVRRAVPNGLVRRDRHRLTAAPRTPRQPAPCPAQFARRCATPNTLQLGV